MSKNSLFCPKKESSITQKVLIEIFFNVIFHLMYMVWLDLDAKSALDTGTPSVEAHKCAVVRGPSVACFLDKFAEASFFILKKINSKVL